jgi:hypothetical protein
MTAKIFPIDATNGLRILISDWQTQVAQVFISNSGHSLTLDSASTRPNILSFLHESAQDDF